MKWVYLVCFSGAAGEMIVGALIGSYGWRNAYLGLAAIVLLFTWPLAVFGVRESGGTVDAPKAAMSGF